MGLPSKKNEGALRTFYPFKNVVLMALGVFSLRRSPMRAPVPVRLFGCQKWQEIMCCQFKFGTFPGG